MSLSQRHALSATKGAGEAKKSAVYNSMAQNAHVKMYGAASKLALVAFAILHLPTNDGPRAYAGEGSFRDFPLLVRCEVRGVDYAFYLSVVRPSGVAVYITPARRAGTITLRGKAEPVGGSESGNCSGKTLEQLRSAGQAYDLQR
jgi:hypothetical protein